MEVIIKVMLNDENKVVCPMVLNSMTNQWKAYLRSTLKLGFEVFIVGRKVFLRMSNFCNRQKQIILGKTPFAAHCDSRRSAQENWRFHQKKQLVG